MRFFGMIRVLLYCALGLALSLVSGCAGYEASKRGGESLAARQWESAITNYRQAGEADPANLEYRATLMRVTEQATNALLADAAEIRERQPAAARDFYRRVLAISPRNDRAMAGLRAIETTEKQNALYAEAVRAEKLGRDQEARQKLKRLMDEVPDHVQARRLLRVLDDKAGRAVTVPTLDPVFQKPVTLELRDATIRQVFDALAISTGINFIFDRDLKQDAKVSVFVRNLNFDDALEQITAANGLGRRVVNHNTLTIYSSLPQKIREYQDQVVRSFFLANADGKQIANLFKTVLKSKDVYLDEKRNLIVMRDTPEIMAMAVKLIAAHDQPEPEVMLEVEIMEVKHTILNDLGLKFPEKVVFGVASPVSVKDALNANSGTINVTGLDKALIVNLMHQIGNANLLANPRVRVRNREKAKIHIGDRVPVVTTSVSSVSAFQTQTVTYLDVGIKLEVEPSIQMDDVVIKMSLEVSNVTKETQSVNGTVYTLGTRNAATTLTLHDGETQVLAGLLQNYERGTSSRFPGLGDIPLLGRLFSNETAEGDKTEILLSITPRIMRNMERPSDDLVEFNAGPEAGRQGGGGQGSSVTPVPVAAGTAGPFGNAAPTVFSPRAQTQPSAAPSLFPGVPTPLSPPVAGDQGIFQSRIPAQ